MESPSEENVRSFVPCEASQTLQVCDQERVEDLFAETPAYVRFEIIDFNGKALSKTVPWRHRNKDVFMFSGVIAIGANARVNTFFPDEVKESKLGNARLVPIWSTRQVLPWARTEAGSVERVYCHQESLHDQEIPLPRTLCLRMLKELQQFEGRGIDILAASELEFTVHRCVDAGFLPLFEGVDIYATLQNSKAMAFCSKVETEMLRVGVDVVTINAEYGPGQLEMPLAPAYGIDAADQAATFRTGVKEIAQEQNLTATFCSKPFGAASDPGNGGHFNFSLWEGSPRTANGSTEKRNVMKSDTGDLSKDGKNFLAGIIDHAPALQALCSPTPPCYTRAGHWAPTHADWGFEDRTAAIRVKSTPNGPADSFYIELRMPSASANCYLVMAGLIAAGLDGLRNEMPLQPPRDEKDNVLEHLENGHIATTKAKPLPTCLEESLLALQADKTIVEALGEPFVRWFVGVKEAEMRYLHEQKEQSAADENELWRQLYMEFL